MDILESTGTNLRYLENNGSGYAVASMPTGLPTALGNLGWLVIGDFNGDGLVDVLTKTSNITYEGIIYHENNGAGGFSNTSASNAGTFSSGPFSGITFDVFSNITLLPIDIDSDGDLDIIETRQTPRFLQNNGGAYSVQPMPAGLPASIAQDSRLIFADFNGDSHVDALAMPVLALNAISYYENDGTGSFTVIDQVAGTFTSGPFAGISFSQFRNDGMILVDYDGDGDLDLVDANTTVPRFLRQNSAPPYVTGFSPANGVFAVAVAANIELTFNEPVFAGDGNIYIHNAADGSILMTIAANSSQVSGSGTNTITIDPSTNFPINTNFYVTFDRNSFANTDEVIFGQLAYAYKSMLPITAPTYYQFSTSSTLPVTYASFNGQWKNNNSYLEWVTATEQQSKQFNILYSRDGSQWTGIGSLTAAGNSQATRRYNFVHYNAGEGQHQYRLQQVDLDGNQHLSTVLTLNGSKAAASISSNGQQVTIQLAQPASSTILLFNMNGQQLYRKQFAGTATTIPLGSFPKGIYQVLVLQNGRKFSQQVVR